MTRKILLLTISISWVYYCSGLCDQRPFGGNMKCCDGKDSTCYVKARNSRDRSGHPSKRCYCDSHCKFTNDCCEDYHKIYKTCKGASNCEISDWTSWSQCNKECGFGTMERIRHVIKYPKNGGKECPPLKQIRGCYINRMCKGPVYQTAFILPISYRRPQFGKWGYENILPAINYFSEEAQRKNQNEVIPSTYSYCIHYKLSFKRHLCQGTWADEFNPDVPVCVECQSRVMDNGHCRGEGAVGEKSRWTAIGIDRCQGDWIRVGPIIPNCMCSQKEFSNFVFV